MSDENIGQGAVLRMKWAECVDAVRWKRNAENGDEISEQDDPKDGKF